MQPNAPIVCFIILLGGREQDERERSGGDLRRSATAAAAAPSYGAVTGPSLEIHGAGRGLVSF